MNGLALPIGKDHGANLSAALKHSERHGLVSTAGLGDSASANVFVHVAGFATDETLVRFDLATTTAQLQEGAALHRKANPVEHEPCGLLGDTQSAGDLAGTDAVLGSSDHPDGGKPLLKAKGRILEDGAHLGRKLALGMRALALPFALLRKPANVSASASRASDAIRPTVGNHVANAVIGIREVDDGFLKGAWCFHDVLRLGFLS